MADSHYEQYKDKKVEHRWRLVASNGRIISDSGEGYNSASGAGNAITRHQKAAQTKKVVKKPAAKKAAANKSGRRSRRRRRSAKPQRHACRGTSP